MNNKGLTLVELLITLLVMSLIAIIVIPKINRGIMDAREDLSSVQINNIESAKLYVDDNVGNDDFFQTSTEEVSLDTLINEGYITGSTHDILHNKNFDLDNSKVIITRTGDYPNYIYEYNLVIQNN